MKPPRKRPFVLVNMSMTADGKIATANRGIESFGSARDRRHLLELRATADAVVCGAGTINSGGVTLMPGGARFQRLRRRRGLAEFNLRVVVSGKASLRPDADLFRHRASPIILLTTRQAPPGRIKRLHEFVDAVGQFGHAEVDLDLALDWLWREWGVRRLVCEGGATLNDAMFRFGMVDEMHVTLCPKLFGGRDAPTIAEGRGAAALAQATRLELRSARRFAGELFLVYNVMLTKGRAARPRSPATV